MKRSAHLVIAAATAGLLLSACGTGGPPRTSPSASPAPATSEPTASEQPTASEPATTTPTPTIAFGYLPLYPFASLDAAQAWAGSYSSGGHQPWHLSADLTALSFAQAYLGFTEIDRVAARAVAVGDAHVTVGMTEPNGQISHAAVIHLVKLGTGPHAPWEVVGTDDTTLTLDVPAYGSTVTSPVKVGGTITGVDESLGAEVRHLGAAGPDGSFCCVPAGGQSTAWSALVPYHAPDGQVLTIAVHTGGHVASVERFAVTGVRAG